MNDFLILAPSLCVLAVVRWCLVPTGRLPRYRVRYFRLRVRLRLHPGRGHATVFELWLRWGRFAAFRRSARARRSLSFWRRAAHPRQHSILVGRAQFRHGLRIPLEEHALIMAPPRTRKTALLAAIILRYPGPVVSTTTKADVFTLTSGLRSRLGPVDVFNPQGIGRVPSTFRWNPVEGCESQEVAIRRADGFASAISMGGVEDSSFWTAKASDYMRAYFHAAALAGGDMRLVARWILGGGTEEAEDILHASGAGQWALQLAELRGEAQKTVGTVRMTMSRSLAFMNDPALMQCVLPGPGGGFDIPSFLARSGTLYLMAEARGEEAPVAALFACLANEIHHTAGQIGQASAGQRLDPPLLLALDEIVQVCPIALPVWLADSGGKGVQIIPVAHGEAQLASRWKDHGKQVILDTCGVKLFLPGITDTRTLEMASQLCGQAAYKEHGQDHHSRHDVMTRDMIRQLPAGHGLVIRSGLSPVVARLQVAWKDWRYRLARLQGRSVAVLPRRPVAMAPAELRAGPGRASPFLDPDDEPESGEPGRSDPDLPWS